MELLKLLLVSLAIAVALGFALDMVGTHIIDTYYMNSYYIDHRDKKYVSDLQKKISDQKLSTNDIEEIDRWVKKQKIIYLQIYSDKKLIYDSRDTSPEMYKAAVEDDFSEWGMSYDLKFNNVSAKVKLYGAYNYRLYYYALMIEIFIAFAVFLFIFMARIRRKMKYILKLNEEIGILEGGDIDYEVTVSGKDELTDLAISLNDMRRSFKRQSEQEDYLVEANRRIITEMSHDLRTPMTSILLYSELLKSKKYKDRTGQEEYLDKICIKIEQMKQLTDRLFEYSLVSEDSQVALMPLKVNDVFYDSLSEVCGYLEEKGFRTETDMQWAEKAISVNEGFISRIFDNITSNIIKYADRKAPVKIQFKCREGTAEISFTNVSAGNRPTEDSTHIGVQCIQHMMSGMGGRCHISEEGGRFCISLIFIQAV